MPQRVVADKSACFGSGNCLGAFPTAFGLDDDDVVEVLPAEAELHPTDREVAVNSCPAAALSIAED